MTQLWRDEYHFLRWTIVLVAVLVFTLLIQTYLLPYGLALLMLVLVGFWLRFGHTLLATRLQYWLVVGTTVFIVGLLGNLYSTQNLPMTLQEIMKWLVGLLIFICAVSSVPHKNERQLYWLSILMIFFILGFLSLMTWIVPALRLLPDMNFLYATFGHNNFSAVLVFIAPWIVLGNSVFPSQSWKWVLAVWVIWLFSTFSRFGVVVGIVELSILALWLKSDAVWRRLLQRWIVVMVSLALVWFGLQVVAKNQSVCAQHTYLIQRICKANQPEQRPEYWRQAVESFEQNPVFGTGLGTFSITSLQHRKAPGSYAAHAHSDYLEWIAEAGWWGVLITLALWGIWASSLPQSNDLFMRAVWLSTGGLLTLGLLDYDLQFVVFLFAVLIGLGWLLGSQHANSRTTVSSKYGYFLLQATLCVATTTVVIWAAVFFMLNLDWQYGNKQLLVRYGQYYPAHSFLLITIWPQLSFQKQTELVEFWKNDYRVLDYLLTEQAEFFNPEATEKLLKRFYQINPWSRQKHDLAALQLQQNNLVAARETLQQTSAFGAEIQSRFNVTFQSEGDDLRWRQARQYRSLAEREIAANNGLQAVSDLYQAARHEPWILDDQSLVYCSGLKNWVRQQHNSDPQWQTVWSEQLQGFDVLDPKYFGSCKTELTAIPLEQLQVQLRYNRCHNTVCKIWTQRALNWSQREQWVVEYLAGLRAQFPTQEF